MQFYLFNIRPKLHHRKWLKLHVTLFRTFSTSPAACCCCSSSNLYPGTLLWTAKHCNLYIHTDIWSKFCLLYWLLTCWLQAVWCVIFKIGVIFTVRFERRKVDKKANLHENWSIQTLFWSILNICAKCHQNRSLRFWAIPFQSWCVFWDTVFNSCCYRQNHVCMFCVYDTGESTFEVKFEADSNDITDDDRPRLYLCTVCDRQFQTQHYLNSHMNVHSSKYKCTECGKCFTSNRDLTRHRRSHSGEKPFECTVCCKLFTRSDQLVKHSRIHSGVKPFECAVCSRRFSQSDHLVVHSRIHSGVKSYKCLLCDKTFSHSASLNIHIRVHMGDKPYKCSLCNKSFTSSSNLQRHKRSVHSNRWAYDCRYCGKLFKCHCDLKCHVYTHTGA